MIDGSCRERILSRLPRMTGTEEKVANYVLANYEEVLHINVAELAKRAGSPMRPSSGFAGA